MKVLIACEFSGVVREAFAVRGHDAWSCDLLPTEQPGQHIQGDVLEVLNDGWDLMIAHPPCTYLANSGVQHLHTEPGRWEKMRQAAAFFRLFLDAPIDYIAVENPVMHGYGKQAIGAEQAQTIQPYQFGHMRQKATCLWLRNLPTLRPTCDVYEPMMLLPESERQECFYTSPGEDRAHKRSRTYNGIAEAMADQWGCSPLEVPLPFMEALR